MLSKALVLSKGSEEPVGQGRCSGFGGGFKAVKISGGCGGSEASEEHIEQPKAARKEMDMFRLQRTSLLAFCQDLLLPEDALPSITAYSRWYFSSLPASWADSLQIC